MKKEAILKSVLTEINWEEIHRYYTKLNIIWNIESELGKITQKIPSINDLQEEVSQLIDHLYDTHDDYISYGNWIVFLERGESVRVIFRLADTTISKKESLFSGVQENYDIAVLENRLRICVSKEEFEEAASLRDKINFLREIDNE